jgi:hypothetical protein
MLLYLHWASDPAWVTAIGTAATALILGLTAIFVLDGLKDARQTRHAQIVTDLSERWDSPATIDSEHAFTIQGRQEVLALFRRLYEPPPSRTREEFDRDLRESTRLLVWPNFLETIGVLHSTGTVSTDVVYRMWGYGVISAWRSWAPIVEEFRSGPQGHPATFRHFETLGKVMEAYAIELGEPFPPATKFEAESPASESRAEAEEAAGTS